MSRISPNGGIHFLLPFGFKIYEIQGVEITVQKTNLVVYNASRIGAEKSENAMSITEPPKLVVNKTSDRVSAFAGAHSFILMNHHESTTQKAAALSKKIVGYNVWGGVILNAELGGLNIGLVEKELLLGAREIWLPTISSEHGVVKKTKGKNVVPITNEKGTVLSALYDVLDLVAVHDAMLGTGYLPIEEVDKLIVLARTRGVRKILVNYWREKETLERKAMQRSWLKQGVYLEVAMSKNTINEDNLAKCLGKPHYAIAGGLAR